MNRFARDAAEDDLNARERAVTNVRGWVADLVRAVANDDHEGVRLLLANLAPGRATSAALLLLADIAGHGDPGVVMEATGRLVKCSATEGRAA